MCKVDAQEMLHGEMEAQETKDLGEESPQPPRCEVECHICEDGSARGREPSDTVKNGLSGWRLALAAAVSFLLPLGLGLVGATLAGNGANRRFVGVCIGLGVGAVMAVIFARVFAKKLEKKAHM